MSKHSLAKQNAMFFFWRNIQVGAARRSLWCGGCAYVRFSLNGPIRQGVYREARGSQ
jgi:hypothetical protein